MKLSKLIEGLELTEAGIKVFEERTRSERQQLYKELWGCLLVMRKIWGRRRGICLVKYQCLILSSRSGDSGIATCVAAHWRCWFRWVFCIPRDRAFSLNCHFVLFKFCCRFFEYEYIFYSWAEQFVWKHPLRCNIARLSLSVSEPHMT